MLWHSTKRVLREPVFSLQNFFDMNATKMLYIEHEGALFRGFARAWPQEVWVPGLKRFEPYKGEIPKPIHWGDVISDADAEAYMRDCDSGVVDRGP